MMHMLWGYIRPFILPAMWQAVCRWDEHIVHDRRGFVSKMEIEAF